MNNRQTMTAQTTPTDQDVSEKAEQQAARLAKIRAEIITLQPETALDRILDDPQAVALVHSFPEQDLHLLVNEIGPDDAIELISLASERQWEYMVDMEIWEKDRIVSHDMIRWMHYLMEADPYRVIHWFLREKAELLEYMMLENIDVIIRQHDQDPADFGQDYFTLDDTYYIKIKDKPIETADEDETRRVTFISGLLEHLASIDFIKYQQMLLEFSSILPAESEEEQFRVRNIRLAEKGFQPFHEAINIYQSMKPEDLGHKGTKRMRSQPLNPFYEQLPAPSAGFNPLKGDSLFVQVLQQMEHPEMVSEIQMELAALCNQIISADARKIQDRKELSRIVEKACGYVSLGLEAAADSRIRDHEGLSKGNMQYLADFILQYPLSEFFRIGYGKALSLKWRAEKWRGQSWFEKQKLPLTFWDERWTGVLGGLLIKKPLFFDNYETGVIYREFLKPADIEKTAGILDHIIACDSLIEDMHLEMNHCPSGFLTYKKLIWTLWIRHYLELPDMPEPVSMVQFRDFWRLFQENARDDGNKNAMKAQFLKWTARKSGWSEIRISQELMPVFEDLFHEIDEEYGRIAPGDLEARYVLHAMIA